MVLRCSVKGCKKASLVKKVYKFPKNKEILKVWLRALNIDEKEEIKKNAVVCGVHFKEDDFKKTSIYTGK